MQRNKSATKLNHVQMNGKLKIKKKRNNEW